MTSRKPGWSAIANPELARNAYDSWTLKDKDLNVVELTLARDYAVMHRLKWAVDSINVDLRNAVCKAITGR